MPNQQTNTPPGTAAPPQRTALEVIEMFKTLGLPVCDDDQAIEQKARSQRDRYLRDKKSPDAQVRERADRWFKNVEAMQNRRPELLSTVYEQFTRLADTALKGALGGGMTSLSQALVDDLIRIACDDCRAESKLADRFVEDYMRERDFKIGEEMVRPGLVEDLTAMSEPGKIVLNWSLPAAKCDEVEIVREDEAPAASKKRADKRERVYQHHGTSFVDTGVLPGAWYTYRAYSIFQGVKSASFAVARAVCLGEPRQARAAWSDGKMTLDWEPPREGAPVPVMIFRRADKAPAVTMSAGGPEPADSATAQVYSGGGSSWIDHDVTEGVTYHYRVIADFGSGLFSRGVDVQATTPKAPPAPPSLSAVYKQSAGKETVVLEWRPAPGGAPVDYVVVRREGDSPAARADEGVVIETTKQTRCLDEEAVTGRRYTYTVFARAGELYSRTGTASAPVDILADVSGLGASAADGTIELRWTTPANTSGVVVRRSLNPPRDLADGALVKLTGPDGAKDEGLRNGQLYHYLVCCAYRPDGATEVFSPGVRVAGVPDQMPEPVTEFAGRAQGQEVVCSWTPSAYGQVVVVRTATPMEMSFGQRLSADDLAAMEKSLAGERIVTTESGRAVDARPDINKPFYTAFTIAGAHAVAGGPSEPVVVCPDVTDLRLSATKDGVVLRWTWPADCKAVRVARRANDWAEGPHDPLATGVTLTKGEYLAAGEKFVDPIKESRTRFHYTVYAQASGAPGQFFASGAGAGDGKGCRDVIQWESWMTLRYQLAPGEGSRKGKEMRLTWSVENPFENCAGFALVAGQSAVPSSLDEGVELFRWKPGEGSIAGEHEAWVSLAPIHQRRWARFHCKLMMIDPAQRHSTLIIHPNTCLPVSETGVVEANKLSSKVRVYRAGVPKEIICPRCFNQFPVGEMLFTFYREGAGSSGGGDESRPGHYTWIDRMRGRPPQPPTNAQGQRLTRKLCPRCEQELPVTAGAQESLVIGMIGAKFSGKSHYVASLIKQLQERVCADMQAALIPMNEETLDRYQQEFYNPLFKNGLELPATAGAPPPLIYDLTLDGRLWGEERNRAITLALYDTAGENFDKADKVQQMVEYLRHASGIIFLVDPLQVPAVREAIPPSIALPNQDQAAAPKDAISRVIVELEKGRVVTEAAPLPTPVAVALTKCDVLRDQELIATNRLWSTEARHVGYFDQHLNEDTTGMMGEYVQRWSPEVYSIVRQRFSRHAFFGVSATGCSSDKQTRRYKYISPWRVEDPLLWLLAELGVIPVR
ncbi:MAG: hypothetical protein AB7U82_13460 [Blastocatellales bacterium]